MKALRKFFGWLFLTDAYMATLTDEQVMVRALGSTGARYAQEARDRRYAELHAQMDAALREMIADFNNYPKTIIFYKEPE